MRNSVIKSIQADLSDLALINQYTMRALSADELYSFSVILCDNEVDRDYERFTVNSLTKLATLFIGKTGIFDHNPKGANQSARIFDATVCVDEQKRTSLGDPYTYVKAKAYMVRTDKSNDLILDIDGGIKKEVSVSCSVDKTTCSICGADMRNDCCKHTKGKLYDGVLCHYLLDGANDAYEWSFVAVPAQVNAGVTKGFIKEKEETSMRNTDVLLKAFKECKNESIIITKQEANNLSQYIKELTITSKLGSAYKDDLVCEVKRLSFLANDGLPFDVLDSVCLKMNISELKAYKKAYEKKLETSTNNVQLQSSKTSSSNSLVNEFRV